MSLSTSAGRVVVVTHVYPGPQGGLQQLPLGTQRFSLGRPLVLGAVQIMIGLMELLFGIASISAGTVGVFSGIFAWGALFYIIAGSLTVSAGQTFNRCLVNGALGLGVVSAVVSICGIIIHCMDAAFGIVYCEDSSLGGFSCHHFLVLMKGFSVALVIFHFLMLAVSITVAAYACNATCRCSTETVRHIKNPEEEHPPPLSELPAYNTVIVDHPVLTP